MKQTKCITFDKEAQNSLPQYIEDKMKAARDKHQHNNEAQRLLSLSDGSSSLPTPWFFEWNNNYPPIILDANGQCICVLSSGILSGAYELHEIISNARRLLSGNETKEESINQVVRPRRMDDNNDEKNLTWQDIKTFANSLSDHQLSQTVRYWGDKKSGGVFATSILNEDFINPSGEGVDPIGMYETSEIEDEPIIYPKGTILMDIDD